MPANRRGRMHRAGRIAPVAPPVQATSALAPPLAIAGRLGAGYSASVSARSGAKRSRVRLRVPASWAPLEPSMN
jgi:hypothetical protein